MLRALFICVSASACQKKKNKLFDSSSSPSLYPPLMRELPRFSNEEKMNENLVPENSLFTFGQSYRKFWRLVHEDHRVRNPVVLDQEIDQRWIRKQRRHLLSDQVQRFSNWKLIKTNDSSSIKLLFVSTVVEHTFISLPLTYAVCASPSFGASFSHKRLAYVLVMSFDHY